MMKKSAPITVSFADLRSRLEALLANDNNQWLKENLSEQAKDKLVEYVLILNKWNQAFDLTAITDPYEMLIKHIMDSLDVVQYFIGYDKVLDVGTGAGLPGIPLAIFYSELEPNKEIYLLDSLNKRIQFLRNCKVQLKLNNIKIIHSRVENYHDETFSAITSRAFAAVDKMTVICKHLLSADGEYILLKSKQIDEELKLLPADFTLVEKIPLTVSGLADNERYIVKIKPLN